MRKTFYLLAAMMLFSFSTAYSRLYTGTYRSVTRGSESPDIYRGKVLIEKCGTNYRVTWKDENGSAILTGIGILKDEIFSVAFTDENGYQKGVASYRIKWFWNDELDGTWAYMNDSKTGTEKLVFESNYIY